MTDILTNHTETLIWTNCLFSVLAAALLTAITVARWDEVPAAERYSRPWLIIMFLVLAYSAGEAAHQNVAAGYRFSMFLISIAGFTGSLVYGLWAINREVH